jgi:hypothetical protein
VSARNASPVASRDPPDRLTRQSTTPSITPQEATDSRSRAAAREREPSLRLFRRGRPLKRWRYVGVFCEELFACAASVQVGPARQAFWALYLREERTMRERTHTLRARGAVELPGGALRVRDAGIELELELAEDDGWAARCADGACEVWTRKQAGIAARGELRIDGGRACAIDARAVIDDTAGHHARHTEWRWSAGVGESPDGGPLAWNLVSGINDPPEGSERAVWVGGIPREAARVAFSADLERIECEDGAVVHFSAEAQRERRENLVLIKSDYRAPFGSFAGTLPGGVELARGLGVVEHHRAVW